MISRCKQEERECYRNWLGSISNYNEHKQEFQDSEKILEIKKNDYCCVHLNKATLRFLKDTRQLIELGFSLPKKVKRKIREAKRFHRNVSALKKIANIYNSIENYLTPELKSVLRESIYKFKEIVNDTESATLECNSPLCGGISGENSTKFENYICCLNNAAENLKKQSMKILHYQQKLGKLVSSLLAIDLFSQRSLWLTQWSEIQSCIEEVRENYSPENIDHWTAHWNYQFRKALQIHLFMGLEKIKDHKGKFKCELKYNKGELQLSPDLPTLRDNYVAILRSFIGFPFDGGDLHKNVSQYETISICLTVPNLIFSVYNNHKTIWVEK